MDIYFYGEGIAVFQAMKIKLHLYWDWFFLTGCIFFLTILWVRFGSLQESISLVGLELTLFWFVLFLIFYFAFRKGQNIFLFWGKQLFLLGVLGFSLGLFWKNRIFSIGGVSLPFFLLSGGAILVVLGTLDVFREREEMLQKLEKQKFLLDFLLEYIPDHIYFKDKESRFIEGSRALARHFSFQRVEDLLGKTDFDIFSETHSKKTWEDERRIIETGEPMVAVEEMETWPDGKVTWVSTTKIPLRDKGGNIVGILGISRNITDLKLKELQIEESERFLSDLFESIQDGISILNSELTIQRVNPFMERYFAHKMPLVGKKCYEVYHDRTTPCEMCSSQEALRTGEKKMQFLPNQVKGEIVGWSEVTAHPFRDREGKILGIIEYVKDVTDRLKAEEALRESERLFRTLAETLPLAIVIYQDNRYIYFNPYTEVLTGYSHEELASMSIFQFFHPDSVPTVKKLAESRQKGLDAESHYEAKIITNDGKEKWVLICSSTILYQGKNLGLASLIDITDRKKEEAKIKHLNMVLRGIREVNQLLAKEKDKEVFLKRVVEILGKEGGYPASFLYLFTRENEPPFATWWGFEKEKELSPLFDFLESEEGRRRLFELFRQKKIWIWSEVRETFPYLSLHQDQEGFLTQLYFDEESFGVFFVVLPREFSYISEERELFFELSDDLAFFMHNLEMEKIQKAARQALEESENKFRTLTESLPAGIGIYQNRQWVFWNPFIEKLTGWTPGELLHQSIDKHIHPKFLESVRNKATKRKRGEPVLHTFEFPILTKDRKTKWLFAQAESIDYHQGERAILVIIFDITERKESEERFRYLTFHDTLTGLNNRAFFEMEAEKLDRPENLPLSILMGDLNGLKLVNDTYGHHAGDELLRRVAEIIKRECSETDIVARYGGDEFVVLSPRTTHQEAQELAEKITESMEQESLRGLPLSMALAYGTKKDPAENFLDILRIAENWMYQRKLNENLSFRSQVMQALLTSLREVNHETEAHSQRIEYYARQVGKALGISEWELEQLSLLAQFHDIGKIAIPQPILTKPGPLFEEEWKVVKRHPEVGFRITQSIFELSSISRLILCHHERFDGSGYPRGLKGEEIPFLSRILAVCDAFDSMVSVRPYRRPFSREEAKAEIMRQAGRQFDPRVVEVFLEMIDHSKNGE